MWDWRRGPLPEPNLHAITCSGVLHCFARTPASDPRQALCLLPSEHPPPHPLFARLVTEKIGGYSPTVTRATNGRHPCTRNVGRAFRHASPLCSRRCGSGQSSRQFLAHAFCLAARRAEPLLARVDLLASPAPGQGPALDVSELGDPCGRATSPNRASGGIGRSLVSPPERPQVPSAGSLPCRSSNGS